MTDWLDEAREAADADTPLLIDAKLQGHLRRALEEIARLGREAPDEFEPPIRQGDSVPEHLYDGSPEMHGRRPGRPIGTMLRASWAAQIVAAVNELEEARAALETLRAEVRLALYRTSLGEIMGRGVLDTAVPVINELLREEEHV